MHRAARRPTSTDNPQDCRRQRARSLPQVGVNLCGGAVVSPRRQSHEAQIHRAVCDHLRLRAKPDVLWLHVPNGEHRSKITGAKLKRMGVLAGASDFLLWHQGNSFALELKGTGGRTSEAQLEFMARFNDAGGHSAVAEGIDRALAVLKAWGLIR
ncbi:MAG: hypothetical protein C5B56_15665 [Proteobacteria bacterium]|nr:MAG: hypothetical protein C5B56_15665 [Pseudomonadota bacterium]